MDRAAVELRGEHARLPARQGRAAGYDVFAAAPVDIAAGSRALVPTGLRIAAPAGTYIRIAPRSGLAWKHGVQAGAGVVDEDYRGEIKVLLFNHGDEPFSVRTGDRVAQLVFERIAALALEEVAALDDTGRGEGGFGSTGK